MQAQAADSGFLSQWWRLGGIAGIVWIILFLVGGFALQSDSPNRDDSMEEIRKYFTDDGDMYLAGDYIIGIAFIFFFLPFVVTLSRVLLRRDDGSSSILSILIVVGGLAATLWGGIASIFWGTLAVGAAANPEVDDSAVRTLMELNTFGFSGIGIPAALFLGAASLAIWRSVFLWRWLAALGGLVAVLLVIGSAWPIDGDEEGAVAILGFIGLLGLMIWVLASSVAMLMRKTPPESAG